MIQFAMLLFGLLTDSSIVCLGWILISIMPVLDPDVINLSAVATMLFVIVRKFIIFK
jgi:hypothetical protein